MNRSTKRSIFFNHLFCSLLYVFLPSWYLLRMLDNFGCFLVYTVPTVLVGFSEGVASLFLILLLFHIFPLPSVHLFCVYFLFSCFSLDNATYP